MSEVLDITKEEHTFDSETMEIQLKADISSWLVMYLNKILNIASDQIDTQETFSSFGLDSSAAIGLTGDLAEWLKYDIDPTAIYDNPSIDTLATFLSKNETLQATYYK